MDLGWPLAWRLENRDVIEARHEERGGFQTIAAGLARVDASDLDFGSEQARKVIRRRRAENINKAVLAFLVKQESETATAGFGRQRAPNSFNPLPVVLGELKQFQPFWNRERVFAKYCE